VVVTVGRLSAGGSAEIHLNVAVAPNVGPRDILKARAVVRSSTALSVEADAVRTRITNADSGDDRARND
jgi:hypothetical protein